MRTYRMIEVRIVNQKDKESFELLTDYAMRKSSDALSAMRELVNLCVAHCIDVNVTHKESTL